MTEPGLTAEDVRRILELIDNSHYGELRLEIGDLRLYVRKSGEPAALAPNGAAPVAEDEPAATSEPSEPAAPPAEDDEGVSYVTSPMVGMFYRSSAPDQPPFVEPGDVVADDDVVCLIEVMKLFNSITAGVPGRVKEVLVENGAMVEYGQRLLTIEPARDAHPPRVRGEPRRDRGADRRRLRAPRSSRPWSACPRPTARRWPRRLADRAVCIGPPAARDSYLRAGHRAGRAGERLRRHPSGLRLPLRALGVRGALRRARDRVRRPRGRVDRRHGRQDRSRGACREGRRAARARLTGAVDRRRRRRRESADAIGYPVLFKATAGGGGRGMRIVREARTKLARRVRGRHSGGAPRRSATAAVPGALHRARAPRRDPGDRRRARQRVIHLGERECSIQRRHQKLIEEAPSPGRRRADCARADAPSAAVRLAERATTAARARSSSCSTTTRERLLLPGDEHAHPGRAPGDRDDHRRRPRGRADPGRRRPAAVVQAGRRRASTATRSSAGSTPRIRSATSRPQPGQADGAGSRRRARASGSTPIAIPATSCRRTTTRCSRS